MQTVYYSLQHSEATIFYNKNSVFISPIYTFPWRETWLFTGQFDVQIGKSTLIILFIKEKMPTFAGNKHPSVHLFLHGPRLFHLSTEKVRVRSVRNEHQSGYSRADTININITKRSKIFPQGENTKIHRTKNIKVQKLKLINTRQVHVYMLHRLNPLLGTKLGFFLPLPRFC